MVSKILKIINLVLAAVVVGITALLPLVFRYFDETGNGLNPLFGVVLIGLYVFFNIIPTFYNRKFVLRRHRVCADGADLLLIFMMSLVFSIAIFVGFYVNAMDLLKEHLVFTTSTTVLCAILVLSIVFWNGIIRIYMTSVQLGIRYRVWGIILGWVFPANLVMLSIMVKRVMEEVESENDRILLNQSRSQFEICHTKYPILMVHGVFFRDFKQGFMNYWGRVPGELITNGATIYYGSQQSAASVAECGQELAMRIRQIVAETGCEKVNVIAHSKGGLDTRYAISKCGVADMVASLTTINTPHRGCEFADYLLGKIPASVQASVAKAYNTALKRFGDYNPDFLKAVNDLTHSACERMNNEVLDVPGVYYQSFGSHMKHAGGGRFPLNYSFHLVKYFDGPNDGLVGEKSFAWGQNYYYLESSGERGISHGDMIDLNRENFDGFDVREFYVQLVKDLKDRGF